ncbi:MAG TPA: gephyrin-like molybdotransferase Glp [Acidimicrobiales bacterium]|nr:gephyrin-like molybdotransferase Glp [Acidimicrobiales bacterium]
MISLDDARSHVLAGCRIGATMSLPVAEAVGAVLAEGVVSSETVPPFDNTAMDGFAVRAVDTTGAPRPLRIVGELAAGAAPSTGVGVDEAIRIMTGAPMPAGADAVVMVERTRTSDDGTTVLVEVEVEPGNHVRRAGDDLRAGTVVFEPGEVLTAGHLGVLCSVGVSTVEVVARPRVGVLSTGDELVDDGSALAPGQIRDSNRRTLLTLVADAGFESVDLGLVRDDETAIEAALEAGVLECDALVTSGGVSMGDYDLVKVVLDRLGDMRWMQIAIKPAKPLAFGTVGDVPVFGLPGNPVSSMVSFELFARPGLRKMAGHSVLDRPRLDATALEPFDRRDDAKTHFVRVRAVVVDGRIAVRSAGGQGSHQLTAMAHADALAVLEPGASVGEGDNVSIIPIRLPGW